MLAENKFTLNGEWDLYFEENDKLEVKEYKTGDELAKSGMKKIVATVPGNFELDFQKAGLIDEPFYSMNILKVQDFEDLHLFYTKRFNFKKLAERTCEIFFEGVDTFSDIYLNGEKIGSTDNMLVPFEFSADGLVDGENEILVHISPAYLEARKHRSEFSATPPYNSESLFVRKAPHMYGWDIMPRALSGGIWRSVTILSKPLDRIDDLYFYTSYVKDNKVRAGFCYALTLSKSKTRDYSLKVKAVCGDSVVEINKTLWSASEKIPFEIKDPKLWWVKDLGEQNLYDVTVELLYKGEVVDTKTLKYGFRSTKLERTSVTEEGSEAKFQYYINNVPFFAKGTNWVPLDAFHSRDKERLPKALEMLDDIGCNMVRCWGGNVYEADEFYDFCDQHGIAVWQDFSMACAAYPQDEYFCNAMRRETEKVVRRLRNHTSIIVWAGDNECDEAISNPPHYRNPNNNRITREVIPQVLYVMDPVRPYLPSSPYIDDYAFAKRELRNTTENHLWGPRDYYKSKYYTENKTIFASETGYHGCTSPDSIKKFISPEKIWPWQDNMEWIVHDSSMVPSYSDPYAYRIKLMASQVETIAGEIPDNLNDFAIISQISQAEAVKFFIERFRGKKGYCTGILWWNLIDGWPQFSDAVVDYYYVKKIAYNYIKNSQAPVLLMFREPENNKAELVAVNEYLREIKLSYTVEALSKEEEVLKGEITLEPNSNAVVLDKLPMDTDNLEIYLIKWKTDDGREWINHYTCSKMPINIDKYKKLMEKTNILRLEGFSDN